MPAEMMMMMMMMLEPTKRGGTLRRQHDYDFVDYDGSNDMPGSVVMTFRWDLWCDALCVVAAFCQAWY